MYNIKEDLAAFVRSLTWVRRVAHIYLADIHFKYSARLPKSPGPAFNSHSWKL